MRRLLLTFLWLAVILLLTQAVYFAFFRVRIQRFNEGQPLHTAPVSMSIHNISALYNDGAGTVWIGTEKTGLYRFDIQKKESVTVSVPHELQAANVRSMLLDRQNRLWVGTSNSGLFIRSGEKWKHYHFAARVPVIAIAPDGTIFLAAETGLISYQPKTDEWSDIEICSAEQKSQWQVSCLAFTPQGHLIAGTDCHGIIYLTRGENGIYTVSNHTTAKRRFGPGSAPMVSPVPLDPCGEGLPSNQINTILTGSDGTLWVGTAAGLAWSRNKGETWYFLRGRDYGDKMRGLLAGTPYGWTEIPRVRFGELLPEDDIPFLLEDTNGILWVGTRTLGCVAVKPAVFYREHLLQPETASAFLTEMAKDSSRFYGTKTELIAAMTALPDGTIMLASHSGSLDRMSCPMVSDKTGAVLRSAEQREATTGFPKDKTAVDAKQDTAEPIYPSCIFLADDYVTGRSWKEQYGKTYALLGGGTFPHDKLIAFDETLCKVRPFVGFVGNRTGPLERITLIPAHHRHPSTDEHHPHEETPALTAWSSGGSIVPRTYDGQHLWCEVKLNEPGHYRLGLYFVDSNPAFRNRPRDYLLEVFPEIPAPKTRIPKSEWQEPGRRADEWAAAQEPLAVSRVSDFNGGVYKRCLLSGPGSYFIRIEKNYSMKVELCSVFLDRLDGEMPFDMPEKTTEQTVDTIP